MKIIKKIGRLLFFLQQKDDSVIRQSVLVVDNGYSRFTDLGAGIKKIQSYFPKSKISVLTFAERILYLQQEFPGLEIIVCSQKTWLRKYRLAVWLFFLRKKDFDYLLNFSLDITPLIVELLLFKSRIVLYNQWGQWCSLRLRNASELFISFYHKQKSKNNFKNLLKRIGLFFVLLKTEDEQILSHNFLIVDDGRVPGQLIYAARRIKEDLPYARVTALTALKLKELEQEGSIDQIIKLSGFIINRYRIAGFMLGLRKARYDYIVLLSLDITPVAAAVLFMRGRVLLNNRWHQWWGLNLKPVKYYLMLVPRLIVDFLIKLAVFFYLLANVLCIFFMRFLNILKINLLSERD
ncbi:MAG: hypothetical protein PHS66_04845 [Candidatus Omnitrophica bacterium]|nr:hypothetical protein [Candidatus Omnitrophota bacterium]